MYVCNDRDKCSELLSQVALTPSFKPWELSDIQRMMRINVQQLSQSPTSSQYRPL